MSKPIKKRSIAAKVVGSVSLTVFLLSICLSLAMWNAFTRELTSAETKYMAEVISRTSLEINNELNQYIYTAQSMAQSKTMKTYLMNIENGVTYTSQEQEMTPVFPDNSEEFLQEPQEQEEIAPIVELSSGVTHGDLSEIVGYEDVLSELHNSASMLGDSVMYVSLCSLYQDDFITQTGQQGDGSFSLSSRPYYAAVTTQKTYMSDPLQDVLTGKDTIAIAEPVFEEGRVIGIVVVAITTEQVAKISTKTSFGETGATMIMDRNNNIIAYQDPSLIGLNISQLDYSGENADREVNNPTGAILDYTFGDTVRFGGIVTISELSGWKMLSAMDSSEFKSSISGVIFRLNIGLFVALLICITFCALSVYKSLSPMKKLEEFMQKLSQGELHVTVDYDIPDEIGRLAQHMNQTASNLSKYIQMVDVALKNFGQGNLTRPEGIEFHGDFKELEHSIEELARMLSSSLWEIKGSITQMNHGASQVASGAQVLSLGSNQQAGSVDVLNGLIENINDTIVTTAKNSSSVTTDAQKISDDLVGSNGKMQELVVSVQDIREMSNEVKRIIKTIEDVAFQTNILSLNASVEAARAGTAGRGFAVVADQVRILSATTAEAAEQTTKIISDIATAIEAGTDLAQSTSKELQQVVDEVGIFVENISTISLSAQNQADAIAEIHRGVENISQVVSQNSNISQESAAASEELSNQSEQIVNLIDKFKLV